MELLNTINTAPGALDNVNTLLQWVILKVFSLFVDNINVILWIITVCTDYDNDSYWETIIMLISVTNIYYSAIKLFIQ